MKRYDLYKDSGVEWIGEVPSHWRLKKLKYFCQMITEKGIPNEGDIKISSENVEKETGICFNKYSKYTGKGVLFKEGDILLNKLGINLKKILFTDYSGYSMGEMIVLRIIKGFPKYFYLTFFHQVLIDELDNQSTGVYLPRVSTEIILNSVFLFPPIEEQEKIVSFLDSKTTLISSLIEKSQRKIELYKEKRSSLISEVVTKGLNPNVEMKNSGIEWIGKIPEHWDKTYLKYTLSKIYSGGTPNTSNKEYWTDNKFGIPWVTISDISNSKKRLYHTKKRITISGKESKKLEIIPKGTLLFSIFASLGKITVLSIDATVNQAILGLQPGKHLNKIFLFYQLKNIRRYISFYSTSSTQENLNLNSVRNLPFFLPPLSEQIQIVKYLDNKTKEIDNLIEKKEALIELLEEYRQSLISEVVIGKQKVF